MVESMAGAEKRQDEPGASYSAKERVFKNIKRWAYLGIWSGLYLKGNSIEENCSIGKKILEK